MDMVLIVHLDYNDVDPGYILYKVNEVDLKRAKSAALEAKTEWSEGLTDRSIEELVEDNFKKHNITYESLTYDVLSIYMF